MARKILILFTVLVLFVAAVIGLALYNANRIAERYAPAMERAASNALGSDVSFGAVEASVFPQAAIEFQDVRVASREIEDETLNIRRAALQLSLLPLLSGQIRASELTLAGPQIVVILEDEGPRVAGIPAEMPADQDGTGGKDPEAEALDVAIEEIAIRDGSFILTKPDDKEPFSLKPINLSAGVAMTMESVRLTELDGGITAMGEWPVTFKADEAVVDLIEPALALSNVTVNALDNSIRVNGGLSTGDADRQLTIQSDNIDIASLQPLIKHFAPAITPYQFRGVARPEMKVGVTDQGYIAEGEVSLEEIAADLGNIPVTQGNGLVTVNIDNESQQLSSDSFAFTLADVPTDASFALTVAGGEARLKRFNADAFSGTVDGSATIGFGDAAPFNANAQVSSMVIEEIMAALAPDVNRQVEGTLQTLTGDLSGTRGPDMLATLQGNGRIVLADGVLKDVNLAKEVLAGISDVPFLSGTLLAHLPENLRAQVEKEYTAIERLTASYSVADQRVHTEDLTVEGNLFVLTGEGSLGFDATINVGTVVRFNPEFSAALAESVEEVSYAFDSEGRLTIPVKVSGSLTGPKVVPDVGGLFKQGVTETIKNEAQGLLDRALGGDDEEDGEEGGGLLDRFRQREQ